MQSYVQDAELYPKKKLAKRVFKIDKKTAHAYTNKVSHSQLKKSKHNWINHSLSEEILPTEEQATIYSQSRWNK